MKNSTEIGQLIRERREKAELSQTQLAAECGCTSDTIDNIEKGKTGTPTLLNVLKALDIPLGEL